MSSLGNSRNGSEIVGDLGGATHKAAAQFTVGANTNGYDLSSVTIEIDGLNGNHGNLVVAIYSNGSSNKPNTLVTTLSGSDPTGAGQFTYNCSLNCTLTAGGKYHVVLDAPQRQRPQLPLHMGEIGFEQRDAHAVEQRLVHRRVLRALKQRVGRYHPVLQVQGNGCGKVGPGQRLSGEQLRTAAPTA